MKGRLVQGLVPGSPKTREMLITDIGDGLVQDVQTGNVYRICTECGIAKKRNSFTGNTSKSKCRVCRSRNRSLA